MKNFNKFIAVTVALRPSAVFRNRTEQRIPAALCITAADRLSLARRLRETGTAEYETLKEVVQDIRK